MKIAGVQMDIALGGTEANLSTDYLKTNGNRRRRSDADRIPRVRPDRILFRQPRGSAGVCRNDSRSVDSKDSGSLRCHE